MSYNLVGFYKNSFDSTHLERVFAKIKERNPSLTQSELYDYQSSKVTDLNIKNFPCILLFKDGTLQRKLDYKLTIDETIKKLRL